MNHLFYIQLATAFIVGGGFIALQTLLAEKVSEKISGLIIAFPSTSALGLFFIGWAVSPEATAQVVPTAIIPCGLSALYVAIYVCLANQMSRRQIKKLPQILLSASLGILCWAIFAIPLAIYKFSNLTIAIPIYIALMLIAHLLLRRKNSCTKPPALKYTVAQKVGRAIFAGIVITTATFLSKVINPFWGGIFTMFPAAFTSTMFIFNWYYQPAELFPLMRTVPIGTLMVFFYALAVMLVFPLIGIVWGTIVAYIISLIVSIILAKIQTYENPEKNMAGTI